jgi:hypothetical protein
VHYQRFQPYQEALAFVEPTYQDGSPVILSVDRGLGRYFGYAYYFLDKMAGRVAPDDVFALTLGAPALNLPQPLPNHITDVAPESLARFRALVGDAEQVWWVSDPDEQPDYVAVYERTLAETHEVTRTEIFEEKIHGNKLVFTEYRRIINAFRNPVDPAGLFSLARPISP